MVAKENIVAMCVVLAFCVLLPVALLLIFQKKQRGMWLAALCGALGFTLTQFVIRLPILSFLGTQAWFQAFAATYTIPYCLILALTAGLFETTGRLLVFKVLLKKRLSYWTGFGAGIGHGGIEATGLIGVTYLNYVIYSVLANSGALPADPTGTVAAVVAQIAALPAGTFLLAGAERAFTIALHMALSVLLCCYILRGKTGRGFVLCMLLHAAVDFVVPLLSIYGLPTIAVEGVMALIAAAAIVYLVRAKRACPALSAAAPAPDAAEEAATDEERAD